MSINTNTHSGPSFSLGNRLKRVAWQCTWRITCRWIARTAPQMAAHDPATVRCANRLGAPTSILVTIWAPSNLEIGDESGIANGVTLYSQGKITIGKRAVISQGTHLCAGTHDFESPGFPHHVPHPHRRPDSVAAEAFVHPGMLGIGEGCGKSGPESVVTKDLPAWMVCSESRQYTSARKKLSDHA